MKIYSRSPKLRGHEVRTWEIAIAASSRAVKSATINSCYHTAVPPLERWQWKNGRCTYICARLYPTTRNTWHFFFITVVSSSRWRCNELLGCELLDSVLFFVFASYYKHVLVWAGMLNEEAFYDNSSFALNIQIRAYIFIYPTDASLQYKFDTCIIYKRLNFNNFHPLSAIQYEWSLVKGLSTHRQLSRVEYLLSPSNELHNPQPAHKAQSASDPQIIPPTRRAENLPSRESLLSGNK